MTAQAPPGSRSFIEDLPPKGSTPYGKLPPDRFWRTGVAAQEWAELRNLYRKKFEIGKTDRVVTAGSCFAQHISAGMRANGYRVPDFEPAPPGLSPAAARRYGYRLFSARYGNIYVIRHLLQLLLEATGKAIDGETVWERDGRYFDAMRPTIEPLGHPTPDEVMAHRSYHLGRVRKLLAGADVVVFTFGLTEAWTDRKTGKVYPTCPGTVAGKFDPEVHVFMNYEYQQIESDFIACRDLIRRHNSSVRFVLTVSPVPLIATASDDHVLVATTYSKSVLRAVAGSLASRFDDVAYFPSYEVITSPWSRRMFYEPNLRDITEEGVETVMKLFFNAHGGFDRVDASSPGKLTREELICEELLLEAAPP